MRRRPRPPKLEQGQLLVVFVNLDKDKAGDQEYIDRVVREARQHGVPCVVCLVETKPGGENVRMIGVGIKLRGRRMVKVGDVGVHRDVEIAYVRVGRRRLGRLRRKVWLVTGHGPHRKSVASREDPSGQKAQNRYWRALKDEVLAFLDTVLFGGDLNNDPSDVATIIGGEPFGVDGDVMGGTVRGGLTIVRQFATRIGKDRGWGGHLEVWVVVQLTA